AGAEPGVGEVVLVALPEGLEEAVVGGAEGEHGGFPPAVLRRWPLLEHAADRLEGEHVRLVPPGVPGEVDEEVVGEAERGAGVEAVVVAEVVLELEVLVHEAAVEPETAVEPEAVAERGPDAGEAAEERVPLAQEAAGRGAPRAVVGDGEVLDRREAEEHLAREGDGVGEAEAAGGGVRGL